MKKNYTLPVIIIGLMFCLAFLTIETPPSGHSYPSGSFRRASYLYPSEMKHEGTKARMEKSINEARALHSTFSQSMASTESAEAAKDSLRAFAPSSVNPSSVTPSSSPRTSVTVSFDVREEEARVFGEAAEDLAERITITKIKAGTINDERLKDSLRAFAPSSVNPLSVSSLTQGIANTTSEAATGDSLRAFAPSSVNPLSLPPLSQGMVNVTAEGAVYRMLPHGARFGKEIDIILPYDTALLPPGYTPNDILTYYYDETRRQWTEIRRDSVDAGSHLVYSRVNHFTDFINAIIKTPEMPETEAYTPTSMSELKAANPMEGITLIQPPTANNSGTANLSYPIDIPAGRQGMQPNLALTYSSGGGNGWLGVGWDLSVPAITVETRWGVPRYEASQESEVYVYQGEQLVNRDSQGKYKPLRHRTNASLPRSSVTVNNNSSQNAYTRFYPRVEEAFDSIVRHGNSPTNYWWSVTDRHGITNYYGKSHGSNSVNASSVLKDADGNIAHWALTETRDPYGNRVLYFYDIVYEEGGKQIYLDSINYTATDSEAGIHRIKFYRVASQRKDIIVSGRYGFKEVTARLLGSMAAFDPYADNKPMRIYCFQMENNRNSNYKSRLKTVLYEPTTAEKDESWTWQASHARFAENGPDLWENRGYFYSLKHLYLFDYYDYPSADSLFGPEIESDLSESDDEIHSNFITSGLNGNSDYATALGASKGKNWSLGGAATAGLGPVFCFSSVSLGGNYDHSENGSEGLLTLIDLDGDGLADKVFKKGNQIKYRKQYVEADGTIRFGETVALAGITSFLKESNRSNAWGLQASAGLSFSGSWPTTTSTISVYFADVNADGLPDLINNDDVLFNSLDENGIPHFSSYNQMVMNKAAESDDPESVTYDTVSSSTSSCGGIIFDGEVNDSIACRKHWVWLGLIRDNAPVSLYSDSAAYYDWWNQYMDNLGFDMFSGEYRIEPVLCTASYQTRDIYYDYGVLNPYYVQPSFGKYPPCPSLFQYNMWGAEGVHLFQKTTVCDPIAAVDPDLDAVKVWIAPRDGYISIETELQLIEDFSLSRQQSRRADGVRVSIQRNSSNETSAELYWGGNQLYYDGHLTSGSKELLYRQNIAADDYDEHDTIIYIHVNQGDILFFRLQSGKNRDFDKVKWIQHINYDYSNGFYGYDGFGENSHSYHSDNDFVLTGQEKFQAPVSGTVHITGNVSVGSLNNNVMLFICRNTTVIYSEILTSNHPAFNINILENFAQYDSLQFLIFSPYGYNTTWSHIRFQPKVVFTGNFANGGSTPIIDSLVCYPSVSMKMNTSAGSGGYNFLSHILFGPLYRGWGQFAYHRKDSMSADSLIDVRLLRPSPVLVLTAPLAGQDTLRFYLDTMSVRTNVDNENSEGLNGMISTVYNPIRRTSCWVEMTADGEHRAWSGFGKTTFVYADTLSNTRIGHVFPLTAEDIANGEEAVITIYDHPVPASTPALPVKTIRKINESGLRNTSYGAGIPFLPVSVGGSESKGENKILTDYMDMNGDGYPDILGEAYVQYSNPWGGIGILKPLSADASMIASSVTSTSGETFGASYSIPTREPSNNPKAAKIQVSGRGEMSVSHGGGTDYSEYTYLDINGDGLPDKLQDNNKVALNLGYRFTDYEIWGQHYAREGESDNYGIDIPIGGFGIAQASIAGGMDVNMSENSTVFMLIDVNGDGLPDKVRQLANFGTVVVCYNLGNGKWSQETDVIPMPSFSYATSYVESANGALTLGFTIMGLIKISFGIQSAPYNRSFSKEKVQMVDFNNDGYVDRVSSFAENQLLVRYNQGAKTNLLKKVTNCTGSQIVMDYDMPPSTYEKPQRSWNLTSVRTIDPTLPAEYGANSTLTTYECYHPHYDRFERIEYGYDSVVSKEYDTQNGNSLYRYTSETYDNRHFNKRGMKTKEMLCDAQGNPYVEIIYKVTMADLNSGDTVGDSECPAMVYPKVEREVTRYYEGQTTPQITTAVQREYDRKRNVIKFKNEGDLSNFDEYYETRISYASGMSHNLISLPVQIEVTDHNHYTRKMQRVNYNYYGKPVQIKNYIGMPDYYAQTDLEYDSYGNISKRILPSNESNQRMEYVYTYDPVLHALPTVISDVLGYSSTAEYDYRFGKPIKTIDMNGNETHYKHDCYGSIVKVIALRELATSAPYTMLTARNFSASPQTGLLHQNDRSIADTPVNACQTALTFHWNEDDYSHPFVSIVNVDGFGRVIQTLTSAVVNGQEYFRVSGRRVFDAFGRITEEHAPRLDSHLAADTVNIFFRAEMLSVRATLPQYETPYPYVSYSNAIRDLPFNPYYSYEPVPESLPNPTLTTYDVMDRVLTVTDPLGYVSTHSYGFGYDFSSKNRFTSSMTDANGNSVMRFRLSNGLQTQISAPLNTVTRFDYSPLGELLRSTDSEDLGTFYDYDLLGRCTERTHPDAGTDRYDYDRAGNMIARQTQNLRNNGGSRINYYYHYNQLVHIGYPEHPENNVHYEYGMPANPDHRNARALGRIFFQEDASGFQKFSYDELGNVIENYRTFVLPNDYNSYTFKMKYDYDSWGRIKRMAYPDNEVVLYSYNHAGNLYSMWGVKNYLTNNEYFKYIDSMHYNKYGMKSAVWYGNNTRVNYQYDDLQRLQIFSSYTSQNECMQYLNYTYDPVSNITEIGNGTAPVAGSGYMGGWYANHYEYDALYRLISSYGTDYTLGMSYSPNGKILQKSLSAYYDINGRTYTDSYTNDYTYTTGRNQLRHIGGSYPHVFEWDGNGNMISHYNSLKRSTLLYCWDEENRLMAVTDVSSFGYYTYDASGERAYKLSGYISHYNFNGQPYTYLTPTMATLYASPYLVGTSQAYTKHYYAGSERVCSKTGGGGLSDLFSPIADVTYKKNEWQSPYENLWSNCVSLQHPSCSIYFYSLQGAQTVQNSETDLYFYHPDHLGSSSWITDASGNAIQHLQYLPFGETMVDQRTTSWNTPYSFSAKEKDEESGYHYFGARYYNSDISIWLSVDPKFYYERHLTPYAYCGNSPIRYIDPNGEFRTRIGAWWWKIRHGGGGKVERDNQGRWYVGKQVPYTGEGAGVSYHREYGPNGKSKSNRGGYMFTNKNGGFGSGTLTTHDVQTTDITDGIPGVFSWSWLLSYFYKDKQTDHVHTEGKEDKPKMPEKQPLQIPDPEKPEEKTQNNFIRYAEYDRNGNYITGECNHDGTKKDSIRVADLLKARAKYGKKIVLY